MRCNRLKILVIILIFALIFPLSTESFQGTYNEESNVLTVTRGSNIPFLSALSLVNDVNIINIHQEFKDGQYLNLSLPDLNDFDLIIIDDIANISKTLNSELSKLSNYLMSGGAFWYLAGEFAFSDNGISDTSLSEYLPITVLDEPPIIAESSIETADDSSEIIPDIDWLGFPQIYGYNRLRALSNAEIHLNIRETGDPFLITNSLGTITICSSRLGTGWGVRIGEWPSFNYVIYRLTSSLLEKPAKNFVDWEYSPIPRPEFNGTIVPILLILWVGSIAAVILIKRRNKPIVSLREPLHDIDLETASGKKLWKIPGPHRLWSGANWQLYGSLLLLIPQTILYVILYQVVFSAEMLGFNQILANLTGIAFSLFDTGTWVAVLYYAGKHAETDPIRAVKYGQFLVWFQFFTGLIQISLFTLFASFIAPNIPAYSVYSWLFFFTGLGQYPGFLAIYRYMLGAAQQFQYQNALNILSGTIIVPLCQLVFGLLGILIGEADPSIGMLLGGAIGLAIGGLATNWILFVISIFFFRRIQFCSLGSLFGIQFDWSIVKEMIEYGLQKFVANIFTPLRGFIYAAITIAILPQASYWLGLIYAAWNISMFVDASMNASFSLTPVAAQAFHLGKKKITSYYLELGRIWYGLLGWMGLWPVVVLTPQLVVGYFGPGWEAVIPIVVIHSIFRLATNFGMYGLALLDGIGKPKIGMIGAGIRLAVMVALWMIFLPLSVKISPLFGALTLVGAEIIAEILYSIFLQIYIFKYVEEKFHIWEMLIAPGLAGLTNLILTIAPFVLILEFIGLWGNQIALIPGAFTIGNLFFIIFIAIMTFVLQPFITYPLAAFFGTFDERLVEFYEHAAKMAGIFSFWAKPVAWGVRTGFKYSPNIFQRRRTIQESAVQAFKELAELQAIVQQT